MWPAFRSQIGLAQSSHNVKNFFFADMELHRTIWELSGEPRLLLMLNRVMSPVIFEIARSYSSQLPIADRYENHRAHLETILSTPLGRVERAVERYFEKLYYPISKERVGEEDGRRERPLAPPRWVE